MREASSNPPILLSPKGFSTSGRFVSWQDIQEIAAYKIDLLTVDEVRFSFAVSSGQALVVSEEQRGFSELVSSLALEFPSVADWESKVINPAFAGNHIVLYRRT